MACSVGLCRRKPGVLWCLAPSLVQWTGSSTFCYGPTCQHGSFVLWLSAYLCSVLPPCSSCRRLSCCAPGQLTGQISSAASCARVLWRCLITWHVADAVQPMMCHLKGWWQSALPDGRQDSNASQVSYIKFALLLYGAVCIGC